MLPHGFDAGNFLIHHLNEYSPSHITRSGASPKTLKGTKNIEISCERGHGKRYEGRIPSSGTTPQPPL